MNLSQSLKQSISVSQGIALYVGAVLGSGILILPGLTAGIAGANALVSWMMMVVLSIPLACTFAFLSIEFPSSGGISTFASQAFGYYAGALSGWLYFIAGCVGQIIVSLTGGMYIAFAFQLPNFVAYLIAAVLLIIAVSGNCLGLKTSGKVQLGLAGLTLLILFSTSVLALHILTLRQLHSILQVKVLSLSVNLQCLFFGHFLGGKLFLASHLNLKLQENKTSCDPHGELLLLLVYCT